MKTPFYLITFATLLAAPAAAFAQASTATGVVGGAAAGAVIGGPVGAVVGGTVGGVVGAAAEPPDAVVTYVEREDIEPVQIEEQVVVGEPLPPSVELRTVPQYEGWRYAAVNDQRVIVEPRTHRVVRIVEPMR